MYVFALKILSQAQLNGTDPDEPCFWARRLCEAIQAPKYRDRRVKQAETFIEEMIRQEKVLDAPMHFPPGYLAETLSLLEIAKMDGTGSKCRLANRDLARRYRWRAEQSFTMGRQYFSNIAELCYLFDDFNDRRRHATHAGQMSIADLFALLRYCIDDRDRDADGPPVA